MAAERREPEHRQREAESQQEETAEVERGQVILADVGDIADHEIDAEQADRHVDEEDAAPVEHLRDQAAERRSHHRTEQRRKRQVVERRHELALRHRFQQHETTNWHHHRAADALNEARDDEER